MYKVAVCDDEPIVREQILLFLRHMEEEQGERFAVACFSSGEELLAEMDRDTQLLLLDIRMGQLSGLEAARKLRAENNTLCILFITSMTQCALEGYEVHAFGFLTKPLQYDHFCRQIQDAVRMLERRGGTALALRGQNETVVYQTSEILYFEVYGRILNVVTQSGSREFTVPLKEVERQVEGKGFFRSHKSFLVNFRHIRRVGAGVLEMDDGKEVLLSKHRRGEFLTQFSRYVRGT